MKLKLKLLGFAVTALVLASCGKKEADTAAPAIAAEEEKVAGSRETACYDGRIHGRIRTAQDSRRADIRP